MRLIDAERLENLLIVANHLDDISLDEFNKFSELIDMTPSVQQWIPVTSESLPEEGRDVLIQMTNSMIVGFWETVSDTVTWYVNSDDEYFTDIECLAGYHEPIAWMPLPQPYKGE